MRISALLLLTTLGLAAAGCATVRPAVPNTASASGPAPVAGYDWFFNLEGEEARLAYGLEESDDLRLGIDCRRNAGRLNLSATGPDGAKDIFIESGGETERFQAVAEPSEVHDGVFLTADAATTHPVFQRFRRVGWVAMQYDGERQTYAAHPASAGNIEKFFAFCG